jgi:hypothetical protein
MAAAAAQARPPRPELQDLKIPDFGVVFGLTTSALLVKSAAQSRAAFSCFNRAWSADSIPTF